MDVEPILCRSTRPQVHADDAIQTQTGDKDTEPFVEIVKGVEFLA